MRVGNVLVLYRPKPTESGSERAPDKASSIDLEGRVTEEERGIIHCADQTNARCIQKANGQSITS